MKFPLSLYIHIPWCVKKCPYCDFNSHAQRGALPEKEYSDQLMLDLESQLQAVQDRPIHSIFIGGGTPSLFSPEAYADIFSRLKKYIAFEKEIEITLEANPGATEAEKFKGFFEAGINRISIGVQSFQDHQLKILGRIHESQHAKNAVIQAQQAGFQKINIDLMFGLPNQTVDDALFDLQTAIDLSPSHLSWYQLTLEPNTYFHRFPPTLPDDDYRFEIQQAGQQLLRDNGFDQYEISAYTKKDFCKHNMNYWLFGDYLVIGAGAHAKFTDLLSMQVTRRSNTKHPVKYLSLHPKNNTETFSHTKIISKDELPLEFMMNALRLFQPIPITLFEARTGLPFATIEKKISEAVSHQLMCIENKCMVVTDRGYLFLNELLEMFM